MASIRFILKTSRHLASLSAQPRVTTLKQWSFRKEHIKTERIKGGTGSIAGAALTDAINGKLEQAKVTRRSDKSKKVHIWFNEDSGVELTPIDG